MVLGLLLLFLKNRQKYKVVFIYSVVSAIVSRFVLTELIRIFYKLPRPFEVLENIKLLIPQESSPAFPSGHAAFYFAFSFGVFMYNKKLGIIFLILSTLMGFARIFVGVHWPLDIIGGAVLGLITTGLIKAVAKKLFQG